MVRGQLVIASCRKSYKCMKKCFGTWLTWTQQNLDANWNVVLPQKKQMLSKVFVFFALKREKNWMSDALWCLVFTAIIWHRRGIVQKKSFHSSYMPSSNKCILLPLLLSRSLKGPYTNNVRKKAEFFTHPRNQNFIPEESVSPFLQTSFMHGQ